MKKKRQRRNPMRARLIREMSKGKSLTEASKIAKYSSPQSAHQALRLARETMPEVIERCGYTDETIIKKYVDPLLHAQKTIFFQNGGVVMDKRTVPALDVRLSSLDMLLRLKNKYPNKLEIEHSGAVLHILTETEKKEAVESLRRIAAFEGKESEEVIDGEVAEA